MEGKPRPAQCLELTLHGVRQEVEGRRRVGVLGCWGARASGKVSVGWLRAVHLCKGVGRAVDVQQDPDSNKRGLHPTGWSQQRRGR